MAYVTNNNLTDAYIQTLITRCGFTDVTAQHLDWGEPYVIRDLNGQLNGMAAISVARDWLITQYLIIQNS